MIAGRNAAALVQQRPLSAPPRTTAIGALGYYVSHADARSYQPSNITHGIMAPLASPPRDKLRKKMLIAERALVDLDIWQRETAVLGSALHAAAHTTRGGGPELSRASNE